MRRFLATAVLAALWTLPPTAQGEVEVAISDAKPTEIQQTDACGVGSCDTGTCCGSGYGCCGSRCGWGHRGLPCCCRMPQHHAYYPALHGYYYFRPYHHAHISLHQRRAAEWGEDPRNPYANDIFRRVYAEYRSAP